MPAFSVGSLRKLDECHIYLQRIFQEVIKGYDCTILCGHRDKEAQNLAYRQGRSRLKWPKGKHNETPSQAIDVIPYPINWASVNRMYHFAGYVLRVAEELNIGLRFGGDWDMDKDFNDQKFNDLVHFELYGKLIPLLISTDIV